VKSPKLGLSREESPNFAAPTMFQFEVSQMSDFWLDKFQYEVYNPVFRMNSKDSSSLSQ